MKESFDIKRFAALFVRHWAEKKQVNGMLWLVAIALMVWVLIVGHKTLDTYRLAEVRIFQNEYPVFIVLQMMLAFAELTKPKSLANFLMLPSTPKEKFLFILLNHLLLPTFLFICTAFLLDWLVFSLFYPYTGMLLYRANSGFDAQLNLYESVTMIFSVIFVFCGYFTFRKNQLLLSILTIVLVFYIGISMLDDYLIRHLISMDLSGSEVMGGVFYTQNKIPELSIIYLETLDNGILYDFLPISLIIVGMYFGGILYVSYLKFKESQLRD